MVGSDHPNRLLNHDGMEREDIARIFDVTVKLRNTLGDPLRVVRTEDVCLGDLHVIIQDAFGWHSCHLWNFEVGRDDHFGPIMDDQFDCPEWDDADDVFLSGLVDAGMKKFVYLYDFGDGWEHTVSIRELAASSARREVDQQLPRCVKGTGATPPEDCGGPFGYNHLVDRSQDSADRDVDEELEYYGLTRPVDPAAFDLEETNKRLAEVECEIMESVLQDLSAEGTETMLVEVDDFAFIVQTTSADQFGERKPSVGTPPTRSSDDGGFCAETDACFSRLTGGDYGDEFFDNCRLVLIDAAEQGINIFSGKASGWAAAAVNVVAAVNMMNRQYTGDYPTVSEVADACGVSVATLNNRSKQLRESLEITCPGDIRYLVHAAMESNFMLAAAVGRQFANQSNIPSIAALGVAQCLPEIAKLLDGRPLLGIEPVTREQADQLKPVMSQVELSSS